MRLLLVVLMSLACCTATYGQQEGQTQAQIQRVKKTQDRAKRAVVKLALKKQERRYRRSGDRATADQIRQVLGDDALFDAFFDGYVAVQAARQLEEDTPVIDFMKWFFEFVIEHKDEIADFIKLIISLFEAGEPEMAMALIKMMMVA